MKKKLICTILLIAFTIFQIIPYNTPLVYAGDVCGMNFYKCINPYETPDNQSLNIIDLPYNISLKDLKINPKGLSSNFSSNTAGTECTNIPDSYTDQQKWMCCQYVVQMGIRLYGECKVECIGNNC